MWLLPSRGRAGNVRRFFDHYNRTAVGSPGVVLIDKDDPTLRDYLGVDCPDDWHIVIGPSSAGYGPAINWALDLYPGRPWYGPIADDMVPTSQGWDQELIQAAGSDGLAFGDDGISGDRLATHPVLGGDLARSLGWISLPGLIRLYMDTVWTEIARTHGVLRYLPDVKTEHWHFSNGLAPLDETYEKPKAAWDHRIYEAWKQDR